MQKIQEYNNFFWDFVNQYDTKDESILRKIIHSYEVANCAFKIACHLNLDAENRLFAYVCGLFHDLGRFEQWKTYHTYSDRASVDHGETGAQIFISYDCEKQFDLTPRQVEILKNTIKYHTKPYMGDDKDVDFYTKIVKNSDAMANINTTANASHKMVYTADGVTPEILEAFENMKPLWPFKCNTKLDRCLQFVANCYYVRYPFLRKEILAANFIDIMCESFSVYLNKQDKQTFKNAIEILKPKYAQTCNQTLEQIEQDSGEVF